MAQVDVTTTGRSARQVLTWSRSVFTPALREAVDSLPTSMGHVAGYHFGWWDAAGRPITADSGKAIRPALALLCAEAVGGSALSAVPAAVAVELVHNFSLLHDDVMDHDETRRHRVTAWRTFGIGDAILAGDSLLVLAFRVLAENGGFGREDAIDILSTSVQALVDGQHADLEFEQRSDVELDECVAMAQHKTGALLSCACLLGALAGGGSDEQVEHLGTFGALLGLAFQYADDLQGIWGTSEVTGKPAQSDLRNRKKSLPIVAALTSDTDAGAALCQWYRDEGIASTPDFVRIAGLVEEAGGRHWGEAELERLCAEALDHLQAGSVNGTASAELTALADLVLRSRPQRDQGPPPAS